MFRNLLGFVVFSAFLALGCGDPSGSGGCVMDDECGQGEYCAADGSCHQRIACEQDEDCEEDEYCSQLGECRPRPSVDGEVIPVCDFLEIEPSAIPPNLLLVVDKSGSMADPTSAGSGRAKIQDTKDALNALLEVGEGHINFGWLQYPAGSSCQPGIVSVDCSPDSVSTIRLRVAALFPDGGTPTGDSLQNANAYQGLHDETTNNYVVLLTDGMPTCPNGSGQNQNAADNALALQAVQDLHDAYIDTFVIGLGEDLNDPDTTNPELLNQMAVNGGRARPGQTKYYPANSLADLNDALQSIGGMVIGCTVGLSSVPEHPAYLWVFFDSQPVDRDYDHINGWDYDPVRNQVNFYGPACDILRSGQIDLVEVIMGCGPPD